MCIFLNLLRREGFPVLPYARVCKLLSHRCIVISEYCNKIDEELFKDIVYFCDVENIEIVYNDLLKKTGQELQNIAQTRYDKFCSKFSHKNIEKLILIK